MGGLDNNTSGWTKRCVFVAEVRSSQCNMCTFTASQDLSCVCSLPAKTSVVYIHCQPRPQLCTFTASQELLLSRVYNKKVLYSTNQYYNVVRACFNLKSYKDK